VIIGGGVIRCLLRCREMANTHSIANATAQPRACERPRSV